jgi:hypothetical protein
VGTMDSSLTCREAVNSYARRTVYARIVTTDAGDVKANVWRIRPVERAHYSALRAVCPDSMMVQVTAPVATVRPVGSENRGSPRGSAAVAAKDVTQVAPPGGNTVSPGPVGRS